MYTIRIQEKYDGITLLMFLYVSISRTESFNIGRSDDSRNTGESRSPSSIKLFVECRSLDPTVELFSSSGQAFRSLLPDNIINSSYLVSSEQQFQEFRIKRDATMPAERENKKREKSQLQNDGYPNPIGCACSCAPRIVGEYFQFSTTNNIRQKTFQRVFEKKPGRTVARSYAVQTVPRWPFRSGVRNSLTDSGFYLAMCLFALHGFFALHGSPSLRR